jgi:hypothetical protein
MLDEPIEFRLSHGEHHYVFKGSPQNPLTPNLIIERAQEIAADKRYNFDSLDFSRLARGVATFVAAGFFDMDSEDFADSE